jgi:outer membrane receptor for ferric coprogen and ferric-rhodotorulic acid
MIAPSIAYDFSPKTRLEVRFEHIASNQSWTPSQLDKNGKLVRAFSSNQASSDMRNLDINNITQAILTSQLNDQWSLRLNTMYQVMNNDWKYTYGMGDVAPLGQPKQFYTFIPNQRFYTQRSWYGDATLDWKIDDLGHGLSNDIFFNVSFDNFWESISFLANNMLSATPPRANPLIDPTNPDLAAMRFQFDYPTLVFPYVTQNSSAVAAGETFGLLNKRLQLIYRGRLNHDQNSSMSQSRTPANTPPPTGVLTGTPAPVVTTNVATFDYGAVFKITPGWALYYGHTEAYSPVATGFTVSGTRLSPESGQDDEFGTKVDMPAMGGIITGSLAYFSMDVSNKWRPDPFNPGFFIQDGPQQNKGYEAQVGYSGRKLSLTASFYSADGPYQKNQPATGIFPAGNLRAVFAPKITYDFMVKFNLTDNFSFGGGYRYQGDQVASTRLLISPGFGTSDVFATYATKFSKGNLKFHLTCTNLSDGTGFMREDSPASVYVQEGRRVKLTTTYTW